jgi:phosphoesterase RecJ-like protein
LASTSAAALLAAADCLQRGADVGMLGERLMRALSASDFRLLSRLQNNTRVVADGKIAYSVADYEEIREAGCGPEDIDDQVKIPRSLAGVKMAILFTEAQRGITRINFRGEQGTSVLPLAERFGGGGHAQAAGARLPCPAAEAVERVIPAAIAAVNGET